MWCGDCLSMTGSLRCYKHDPSRLSSRIRVLEGIVDELTERAEKAEAERDTLAELLICELTDG